MQENGRPTDTTPNTWHMLHTHTHALFILPLYKMSLAIVFNTYLNH